MAPGGPESLPPGEVEGGWLQQHPPRGHISWTLCFGTNVPVTQMIVSLIDEAGHSSEISPRLRGGSKSGRQWITLSRWGNIDSCVEDGKSLCYFFQMDCKPKILNSWTGGRAGQTLVQGSLALCYLPNMCLISTACQAGARCHRHSRDKACLGGMGLLGGECSLPSQVITEVSV